MIIENDKKELQALIELFKQAFLDKKLVKIIASKSNVEQLNQVYGVLIELKGELKLKLTFRYETKDETKNYSLEEFVLWLEENCPNQFKIINLITENQEINLSYSKKYKAALTIKNTERKSTISLNHDRIKNREIDLSVPFLKHLGISDASGKLIPKMADKYRQINKYIEIIDNHLAEISLKDGMTFVDMGSGKGYLTFALYHHLLSKNITANVVGVELREDMVNLCNKLAETCGFTNLSFVKKRIEDFTSSELDVLIALHACNTATDDAIAAGIKADCDLIICAPCCHKQVRQSVNQSIMKGSPILKHGIFQERACEMLTDAIRALILESKGYETKVFEFISLDHTSKNIMITGVKTGNFKNVNVEINALKKEYGLELHYLESIL